MFSILRAIGFGTLGGALCYMLGVPAPWLAGSLVATIIAVYTHQRLDLPEGLRSSAFILLGVQTGTAVNADTLTRAAQWPLSILFLAVTVGLIVWSCTVYYTKFRDWDRPTALFASLPGALSLVILLASSSGADMRRVTIAQCVRLFFLIAALPAVIKYISPLHATGNSATTMGSIWEIIILVVASAAMGLFFAKVKIPAGLILGVMIGLRFKGISFSELRAAFNDGFAGFVIAMVIAIIGAVATSAVAGLPLALTLLAFAPGGLEAMTIMAFALNLDPAYVAAHQVARYIGMVILMPAVTAYVLNRGVSVDKTLSVEQD